MRLNELKAAKGAIKTKKRLGRGPGSGRGKTAGRGHKGQKARTGKKIKPWFEGGQMPLHRRLPKRGFTNIFKKIYSIVNLSDLNALTDINEITPDVLIEKRKIRKKNLPVKILGHGEISRSLIIKAHAFSKTAIEKIENAGGKVEVLR